ncbi:actin-binding protein WASF1-like [Thunnus thynnus]|uniref:actin-binding protein WASF1-like n=1 Tax=Thunnus thynnus TaxID=8237 RepID=UPI003527A49E
MATAPPPPPPPPPPTTTGVQSKKMIPPPCPKHAAVPYFYNDRTPIQETSPSPDPEAQAAVAPSPHSVQNGPQSSLSQGEEDNLSDCDDKDRPIQETDPAPQALNGLQASTVQLPSEAEVQVAFQMNQGGEHHLA